MSKKDALVAYRDSLFDAAEYGIRIRSGSRSIPIIGGLAPALQLLGNALMRPFKVAAAWVFGYEDTHREFPPMPEVPAAFKDSSLGNAFAESWKLKEEAAKARVEGFAKLVDLDISGWWQKASVASFAETKDTHVVFAEEGRAQDRAASAGFVDALGQSSHSGVSR